MLAITWAFSKSYCFAARGSRPDVDGSWLITPVVTEVGLAVAFFKIRQQWSLPYWWTLLFTNDFSVVCRADSILFTVEFLLKLESILSDSAATLLTKVRQYSTSFVIISTIFTSSLPRVDYISRNHFLCSFIRSNFLSIQVFFFFLPFYFILGIVVAQRVKIHLKCGRPGFDPWIGMIPWRREWQPTPVFLPGESHGQRSLGGYSPWGHKELDMTDWLSTAAHSWLTILC